MKKISIWVMCAVMCIGLMACGEKEKPTEITENTIIVLSDGTISGICVDIFDKDYYTVEGLQAMAEQEAADYNQANGVDSVKFDKIENADDNVVKLYMNYANCYAYEGFNGSTLYVGTIQEAYNAGVDLDVSLYAIDGSGKTVGKDDLLGMSDKHVMILSETSYVELPGSVMYASNGVSSTSKSNEVKANFDQDLIYIIYK